MSPRQKREKAIARKRKDAASSGNGSATAPGRAPQRWARAIGAGTLVLSPISLTAGVVAAWPGPAHPHAHPAPVGFGRPDPQYQFGFPDSYSGTGVTGVPHVPGVTGAKPRDSRPSAAVVREASKLANHTAQPAPPRGRLGIPGIVLRAYLRGQQILSVQQPGCHLPWWLLAGIGKVESDHADNGLVDASGNALVPILGPVLNGTGGDAAIAGPGGWERAVGPMQFLPSTWQVWGGGGNPENVFDAALAAGRYLCTGGRNLSDPAQQVDAVFSYNPSNSYVQLVLAWAYGYASGVVPLPSAGGAGPGAPSAGASHGGGAGSGGTGSGRSSGGSPGGSGGSSGGGPGPSPTRPAPSPTSPAPGSPAPTQAPASPAPSPSPASLPATSPTAAS